jgi:hypothetical protein
MAKRERETKHDGVGPRRIVICYNRACADYRRERDWPEPCACKKVNVREPLTTYEYEQ